MALEHIIAVSWWMILPLVIVGSLLHFVYEWSGGHRLVGIFGAVNESYWEHIKIAVWPVVLLQAVLLALGGHEHASFIPAATLALYSIPVTMYGAVTLYKLVTGRNVLWIDIAVFAVCIAAAQAIFVSVLEQLRPDTLTVTLAAIYGAGLLAAFLRFTLRPPAEPDLFIDPITGSYGVPRERSGEPERVAYGDMEFVLHATAETTGGALAVIEEVNAAATPSHTHHAEDELFFVLEGEHVFTVGGRERRAGPGELVFAPRGVAHAKRQVSRGRGRTLTMFSPPGFEQFFRDMAAAAEQGPVDRVALERLGERHGVSWHLEE